MDSRLLNDLIKNRCAVFPYQFTAGKKIDDSISRQLLINATWAPNHGMTEPWYFTKFTGERLQARNL